VFGLKWFGGLGEGALGVLCCVSRRYDTTVWGIINYILRPLG